MVWSIRAAHGVLRYSAGITAPSIVGEPAAALPCVVMAHGFSGTMDRLFRYAERFATAGMAVLVFDYRNFGASGGQPRQLIDIPGQQADWRAAIRYAPNHQAIDPQRTALWGSSLGRSACRHLRALGMAQMVIARAPKGQVRRYPGSHFQLYHGPLYEQVVADQLEFLKAHLVTAGGDVRSRHLSHGPRATGA
jgi:alpha-beta hydrolase superfamily lysophospholipase